MAKYRPGKSGVPTRKIKEVKKKISAEKEKTKSDKDRIADLEKQLAILLARTQQKQDRISDRDIQYDNFFKMGPMSEEERKRLFPPRPPERGPLADRKKRAKMNPNLRGLTDEERKKLFSQQPTYIPEAKKGGGHVKKYTGGNSGDKYYGGGPVYPRPTKGS